MHNDEPGGEDVDNAVEEICGGCAVEGRVEGEDVEEGVGDVPQPIIPISTHNLIGVGGAVELDIPCMDSRDHSARRQSLNEQDKWHYRQNIMV